MNNLTLVISLFALFSVFGMPLAFALCASSLFVIVTRMNVPLVIVVEKLQLGVDSFLLLAVPLFILAASVMNQAGITSRIFNFARAIVGWLPGALGHANVIASIVFAGISGSAVADSAALGNIEIKSMVDQGYPKEYAAAMTCASATIGPIFPPSIPMVIYAGIASVSVGKMFVGGMVPGLLIGFALMILNHFIAKKNHYPRDEKLPLLKILSLFIQSFLPLMTPVIIIGGIVSGVFTPTEAAAFTVLYACILGFFVYRELKLSALPGIMMETIITSGVVLFIISGASLFSWILTVGQLGKALTALAAGIGGVIPFIIITNLIFLFLGMFMETTAILIVLTPFFIPIAQAFHIDLVHFGVMMVLNLMIGLSTPPFGLGLFTVSQVAQMKIENVVKGILPFIPVLIIVLILVMFIPQLTLWLPGLIY
jgi:tripartite ATP-independent transporter DctM subunit